MADCFPPESDNFHHRWLPQEIFTDIGIADPEAAATEPMPEAAGAGVEQLMAQLASILGGGARVWPMPAARPIAPCWGVQVYGLLEGCAVVCCNATNGGGAVSWPFVPYPQLLWKVGSSLVSHGGALDYPVLPPAPRCHVPPQANLRGGTDVFLPRVEAYRY